MAMYTMYHAMPLYFWKGQPCSDHGKKKNFPSSDPHQDHQASPPRYSDFDPSCTQVIHRIRHCKQAEKNGIPGDKFGPGFGVKMG